MPVGKEMDEMEFRRLLQVGHGRAIQYAKDQDVQQFRDVILDACLHCYACDPVFEGTRADYMLELVDLMPEKDFFYGEILKALPGSGDDWDAAQRFRFAACLAFDGIELAKEAMYKNYAPGPRRGEGIGINFVQMDGVQGLLFAAEKIGALLMAKPGVLDVGWLLSYSIEEFGEQETRDALKKAAAHNPRVEAYQLEAKAREERLDERLDKSRESIGANYEQLKPKLREMTFPWSANWGEQASEEDLAQAAQGLIAARNPKEQLALLRIFARRRFPLDIQTLLKLVDVDQERVGFAAIEALKQIKHPKVRRLAFRLVDTRATWRGQAIDLLAANFQSGDHAVVLGWFKAEQDSDARHSLGLDITDFWERHPHEESEVPMLLALYELGPCSFCREGAVRRLIERNALTEEMRTECAYDANDEIRKLVEEPSATKT